MTKYELKNQIQSEYEASPNDQTIKALTKKYGAEAVNKYILEQLCVNCEVNLFTCYDRTDEQSCDSCAKLASALDGMPVWNEGESKSEYFRRVGEYAASLDDGDVATLENELEKYKGDE